MTTLAPDPELILTAGEDTEEPGLVQGGAGAEASGEPAAGVNIPLTSVATLLSVAAAGWMCAGVFRGAYPRVVGLLGSVVGVGLVALSYRTRRPSIVQAAILPVALVVGGILVGPAARGTSSLPGLVAEAVRSGGLAQAPVAFDPGWRFILMVVIALLGNAACALAIGVDKPKLGVFLPVPVTFVALLVQPSGAGVLVTMVSVILMLAALAVSFGVELAREGATSGRFEARRLVRGAAMMAALLASLFVLAQVGFLFPEKQQDQVIPPKRPETPPPEKDRVLFTVTSDRVLTWRLGVLDVYDGRGWLTPPFDTSRFAPVPPTGEVPLAGNPKTKRAVSGAIVGPLAGALPEAQAGAAKDALEVQFTVAGIEGHLLPSIANPQRVQRQGFTVDFDPRTQTLRLPEERAAAGMTYTLRAPLPPGARELAAAPSPPPSLEEFIEVPTPPPAVADLLAKAPTTNSFERLQFVRNSFYERVVAAGAGKPVDVPPERVEELLAGQDATPFEITAAEVLLARWAGVPARIGYGFYGGEHKKPDDTLYEVRPKHGSTWLEAYFQGYGWVPIVGTPPKAKSSLGQAQNDNPSIRPTEDLAVVVYVPVKLQTIQLLYVLVRYWVGRLAPYLISLGLVLWLYPGIVKRLRAAKRRRWAATFGPRERIAVAYAELRDTAADLNIGEARLTPVQFVKVVDHDPEHAELAWLVTRALWGDLVRDLHREDVGIALEMAGSVRRRLLRAQGPFARLLAFASRASLQNPYADDLPNLWFASSVRARIRSRLRGVPRGLSPRRRLRRLRAGRVLPAAALLVVLLLAAAGCVDRIDLASAPAGQLPERVAPDQLDGYGFRREPAAEEAYKQSGGIALVSRGEVYSVTKGDDVLGSLQVAALKPGLAARRREVRNGVLQGIGAGRFELTRVGPELVYALRLPEQRMLLWFPPSGRYYVLLIARQGFDDADALFTSVLAYQRGEARVATAPPPPDLRRGSDG